MSPAAILAIIQAVKGLITIFGPDARSLVATLIAEHRDPTPDEITALQAARHAAADRIREA